MLLNEAPMTQDEPFSSPPSPIRAGVTGRCPRCGKGCLFRGYLGIAPRCEACGLDFSFADAGDGPAIFVMLIAGFIVVSGALAVEILYRPPYWVHALLWGTLGVVVPLAMLRPFKGVMVALQYHHKAGEGRRASDES